LARHGLVTDGTTLSVVLAREPVPLSLIDSTVQASLGFATKQAMTAAAASSAAAALASGALHAMMISKIKILGTAAVVGIIALGGAHTLARQYGGMGGRGQPQAAVPPTAASSDVLLRSLDKIDEALDDVVRRNHELQSEVRDLRKQIVMVRSSRPDSLDKRVAGTATQPGKRTSDAAIRRGFRSDASIEGADIRDPIKSSLDRGREPANAAVVEGAGAVAPAPHHSEVGRYIVMTSPKGDRVTCYDRGTRESKVIELAVPDGSVHTVTPMFTQRQGILALNIRGPKISRIAAFTLAVGQQGEIRDSWYPQELREPVDQADVTLAFKTAAYVLGRHVYAFSAFANRWDVLELPAGSQAQLSDSQTEFKVEHGGHLYTFNALSGKWDDFDLNAILDHRGSNGTKNAR